jgi:hypothetical protein
VSALHDHPRITALSRIAAAPRRRGIGALCVKALAATCCSRLVLLGRDLREPLPDVGDLREFEFEQLTPASAEEYAALVPGSAASRVRERLRTDEICFGARWEGRLVRVAWVASGSAYIPYLRSRLALEPGQVYGGETYVAPDLRGRRVAAITTAWGLARLREAGYHSLLTTILPENGASFRAFAPLDLRPIATAYGIGLGRLRRCVVIPFSRVPHQEVGL